MIATHVKVSLTLHKLLKFRNAEGEKLQNEGSKITKEIGNATEDSEITFEYTQKLQNDFKDQKQSQEFQQLLNQKGSVPFQMLIEYRTLEGMKCLRVQSQQQEITEELEKAEQNINMQVMANHARSFAAQQAFQGNYRGAQAYNIGF